MNPGHVKQVRILYKTILKLHKGMPPQLQIIGDGYVKDEFKRHKKCRVEEANRFMKEWSGYAITLAKQLGVRKIGKPTDIGKQITDDLLNNLRDDQIQQLYDLMVTARDPPEPSVKK